MIEFKAECGHKLRAKDEDAGDLVRCSYCGRQATVPGGGRDDLEFLFRDVQQPAEAADPRRRKRRRRRWIFAGRARAGSRLDPFAIILRMCYAAALIIIVIIVADRYVLPLFEKGGLESRFAEQGQSPIAEGAEPAGDEPPLALRPGLIDVSPLGLHLSSTPPGATVYFIDEAQAPPTGRIQRVTTCNRARANVDHPRPPDGTYAVEVVLPWNHPSLNDPSLPYYENYWALRRAIESASDEDGARLLEEFFVPDEARAVFVDQTEDQIFIVRQYRNVSVRNGRSEGVRALFLPKIKPGGGASFKIPQLVTEYLPQEKAYAFDEDYVRNELMYYDVPESDRLFVVLALARIGLIPYVTPDGRTRLFKIGIHDGMFSTKIIRDTSE